MAKSPIRQTKQRTAILKLLSSSNSFLSAREVFEKLRNTESPVGIATVYRVLNSLLDSKEIDILQAADGEALFRACGDSHHHHIRCITCGLVEEFIDPDLEDNVALAAARIGFTKVAHTFEISGTCPECADESFLM